MDFLLHDQLSGRLPAPRGTLYGRMRGHTHDNAFVLVDEAQNGALRAYARAHVPACGRVRVRVCAPAGS